MIFSRLSDFSATCLIGPLRTALVCLRNHQIGLWKGQLNRETRPVLGAMSFPNVQPGLTIKFLHCCQNLLKEMLCALYPIPGTGFVLQGKDPGVVVVEHDAHIALNVGLAKAIPELGVDGSVRVRS